MWDSVKALWDGLPIQLQTAVASVVATIVTGSFGAVFVIWQIGRQARNAIRQGQHNETLKLKLKIYEDIIAICRDASAAESDLSTYIRLFESAVSACRQQKRGSLPWSIPDARVPALIKKNHEASMKAIEIIMQTERWEIIDPRIGIFRTAINVANYDILNAFQRYFNAALRMMPHEMPSGPTPGSLFPWQPPSDQDTAELETLGREFLESLSTLGSYIYDFQVEMQNLLLGELFKRQLPPRQPIDPRFVVVRLDRCNELAAYFENETAWGHNKTRIENDVRAALAKA